MCKRLCAFFLVLLLAASLCPAPVHAASGVTATIPTYTWELEYRNVDYKNSVYPPLNYKGVTYFPMTWDYCRLLGLTSVWIDGEGLFIASWGSSGFSTGEFGANVFPTYEATHNPKTVTATLPTYPIWVNGKRIDNAKEEYPLLNFRGVTYFPMTWRFAREEFDWNTEWSQEENRFAVHLGIDSDWFFATDVYELTDTAAYLFRSIFHNVPIGVDEDGDVTYTVEDSSAFCKLDFATGEVTESEKRPSFDAWMNGEGGSVQTVGRLPEGVTIRKELEYTESPDVIPSPYTPFVARGYVTVDGTEYLIDEGIAVTDAARAGGYVFCNARRYTGWKGWTNPNEELYRIDAAKGTVERLDTQYENYGSMKLLGCAADGKLYLKCQQGSSEYGGEGGVMEASAYNDGYYKMDAAT
ncbi:MAG: hypothetical protein K6G54_09480, partial [Oscillospiraceae bacterium]|nr:hypothetical protein [Oscillospiraceae bacterium]